MATESNHVPGLDDGDSLAVFAPERPGRDMRYAGLVCRCGDRVFHLAGWPKLATGRGGFFWRSFSRVFREARVVTEAGEPVESPYWLPLFATCDRCGRVTAIFDDARVADRLAPARRAEPRESYRCRVCRRGAVAIVVGHASDPLERDRMDCEVVVRCARCLRQARVAWAVGRASEQEARLDALYGRR